MRQDEHKNISGALNLSRGYSGVIAAKEPAKIRKYSRAMRLFGFREVKVKGLWIHYARFVANTDNIVPFAYIWNLVAEGSCEVRFDHEVQPKLYDGKFYLPYLWLLLMF